MNHKYRSMFMCGYVHLTEKGVDAKALETKMEPHEHMDDFKKNEGDLLSTKSPGGVERQIWRLLHIKRAFVKLLLCPEITFNKIRYSGQIKQFPLETLLCSFLDMLWINNKPMLYMPKDPRQKMQVREKELASCLSMLPQAPE